MRFLVNVLAASTTNLELIFWRSDASAFLNECKKSSAPSGFTLQILGDYACGFFASIPNANTLQ